MLPRMALRISGQEVMMFQNCCSSKWRRSAGLGGADDRRGWRCSRAGGLRRWRCLPEPCRCASHGHRPCLVDAKLAGEQDPEGAIHLPWRAAKSPGLEVNLLARRTRQWSSLSGTPARMGTVRNRASKVGLRLGQAGASAAWIGSLTSCSLLYWIALDRQKLRICAASIALVRCYAKVL